MFKKTPSIQIKILFFCLIILSCTKKPNQYCFDETKQYYDKALYPFYHGVASGDPTSSSIVIWTRITPKTYSNYKVKWQISKDSIFNNIIQDGTATTDSISDYTIKVNVKKLHPNTYYWYRFFSGKKKSIVGRTKTLPKKSHKIRLIAISCNAYEAGYFNAFDILGNKKDTIDAVVHLGDYIYESYSAKYIAKKDRTPLPKKELISLKDYRTRYAQYRLDKKLQKAHQMHPFINIWDDHEIANDAYVDGAQSHSKEEGSYESRKENAKKAFYEWIPIDETKKHYRNFVLGNLGELFMLDGRLEGRTKQESTTSPNFKSDERHLLGKTQVEWLKNEIKNSKAKWKLIGNPVLFADFDFSVVLGEKQNIDIDSWKGYPYERQKLIDFFKNEKKASNVVFISGDSHCSWAFEILSKNKPIPIAIELGVPSITSGNWGSNNSKDKVDYWQQELHKKNSHLKYINLTNHGFLELELYNDSIHYTWNYVDINTKNVTVVHQHKKGYSKINTNQIILNK